MGRGGCESTAVRRLAACGETAASFAGWLCITERSPGSESAYLHVERHATWYGLRLSSHAPAYACSRDYEQIFVPPRLDDNAFRRLALHVAARVRHGGRVVASPADVQEAFARLTAFLADGMHFADRQRNRWRWSAETQQWRVARSAAADPPEVPPPHRPVPHLSLRIRAEIRHLRHQRALWEAEEQAAVGRAVAGGGYR
jgi:hypothetical protein